MPRVAQVVAASLLLIVVNCVRPPHADALPRTWVGNDNDWDSSNSNWAPADEPDSDDEAIFNSSDAVHLAGSNAVQALTMSGGIDLHLDGNDLAVSGLVDLSGASTFLNVGGSGATLSAGLMNINSGSQLTVSGGSVLITAPAGALVVDSGATLRGNGTVIFAATLPGLALVYGNDGVISAASTVSIMGPSPPPGTLTFGAVDSDARMVLDGLSGAGVVNVFRNQRLEILIPLYQDFTGDINLSQDSTLDIAHPWTLDGGSIDVFSGSAATLPPTPAGVATIDGGQLTQNGGVITVHQADGTLEFDTSFISVGGTIVNNGLIRFDADSLIGAGVDFQMGAAGSLEVNSTVSINDTNWDWDGDGGPDNVITINKLGSLTANITAASADDLWSAAMFINGNLNVQADDNDWGQNGGSITIGGTAFASIEGDRFVKTGGSFVVLPGTFGAVYCDTSWGNGVFDVDGGLQLLAPITWAGATVTGDGLLNQTAAATAEFDSTINVARFKWDGGPTTVNPGVTLTVDVGELNFFDDINRNVLNVNSGTLSVTVDDGQWKLGTGGDLNLTNTGAGNAVLNGSTLRVIETGRIDVDGGAQINAPLILDEGSTPGVGTALRIVGSGGTVILGGGVELAGGDILDLIDPSLTDSFVNLTSNLTVTGVSTVAVEQFNWDGGNTTVQPGGALTIDVDRIEAAAATQQYDAILTINSGATTVDVGPMFAAWIMDGTLNLNNTTGAVPTFGATNTFVEIGDDAGVLDADINVSGAGQSAMEIAVEFMSDADVNIVAGSTLRSLAVTFQSQNGANNAEFTGAGTWLLTGLIQVNEVTTINMTGGTVDFDNSSVSATFANDMVVNAPLVVNAATLANYGSTKGTGVGAFSEMTIDSDGVEAGSLTVNLDSSAAEWTLQSDGILELVNGTGAQTLLAGSPANLNGRTDVTGDVRTDARVDIGGTINVLSAGEPFRLSGGSSNDDPNTIAGGVVNGPGVLGADSLSSLHGFGTINAGIDFDGVADLLADDGILTLNGAILDVNVLGTADADGILNIPAAWSTSGGGAIALVRLAGGELRGGAITNDHAAGINGFGLVSSRVINSTRIDAEGGGVLVVQTVLNNNDWDGVGNAGQLNAVSGNLEIRDNASFNFLGSSQVQTNRELFVNGFSLHWEPGSALALGAEARLRTTAATNFGGAMSVAAGLPAEVQSPSFIFEATSTTTIAGTLRLNGTSRIDAGASLTGGGTLLNAETSTLQLLDGAGVGVRIENQGTLEIDVNASAQATALAFQQDVTGRWVMSLAGLGPNDFDRLDLTGGARLSGALDLELAGGYVPAMGHTFDILSAPGGVTGAFTAVHQPAGMPAGVLFDAVYSPTLVQLIVVSAPLFSADFDVDGDVDGDDLNNRWKTGFGPGSMADADADGDSDGADFLAWQQQLGSHPAVATGGAMPEPGAGVLALAAAAMLAGLSRKCAER